MPRGPRVLGACALVLAASAPPAIAQQIQNREQLLEDLGARQIAAQVQSLINFTALPDISGARFTVDADPPSSDARLNTVKLPWNREWPLEGTRLRLYTEANLGLLLAEQRQIAELAGPDDLATDVDWRAISGLGGIGLAIPLTQRLRIRPVVNVIYSYLENEADVEGPLGPGLEELLDDVFINYHVHAVGAGGTLELAYVGQVDQYGIELTGSVSQIHTQAFEASSQLLEVATDAQTFNARAELSGPAGFELFDRAVAWKVLYAGTILTGDQVEALGFSYFIQVGGGLEIDVSRDVEDVDRVGFRIATVQGDGVSGIALGLTLDF